MPHAPVSGAMRRHAAEPPLVTHDARRAEIDRKADRVAALAAAEGVSGVLLAAHWNAAWLTAGGTTRVDVSREAGAGALLVTLSGRRAIVASNIEAPRLAATLDGFGFDVVEHDWLDERADPGLVVARARMFAGGAVASDLGVGGTPAVEGGLARLRVHLDSGEIERLRVLGADAARVMGHAVSALRPGVTEAQAADTVASAVAAAGMTPLVLLAGADDRPARFRHPIPGTEVWRHRLLVGACVERGGLVVALSRVVSAAPLPADAAAGFASARHVYGALLDAGTDGARAAAVFDAATSAYASVGHAGEERRHHQGGAIAYRPREWIAHPASSERLAAPVALAWNPTVGSAKIEETCLLRGDGTIEVLTTSQGWPVELVSTSRGVVEIAGVLRL